MEKEELNRQENDPTNVPDENPYIDLLLLMRRVGIHFQQMCRIPAGEFATLMMLGRAEKDGQKIMPSDLGRKMRLSRPAVSRMLHNLENKGYICKKNNRRDHRYVTLEITEKGLAMLNEELERSRKILSRVVDRMGVKDMSRLLHYNRIFCNCLAEEIHEHN